MTYFYIREYIGRKEQHQRKIIINTGASEGQDVPSRVKKNLLFTEMFPMLL
jgi:hypothetical protein